jgi:hypothetical protein
VSAAPIRRARPDELEALLAIERDAGALFATVGMPEIARDDPGSAAELEPFRARGRAGGRGGRPDPGRCGARGDAAGAAVGRRRPSGVAARRGQLLIEGVE